MPETSPEAHLRLKITEFERLKLPGRWEGREISWAEWAEETCCTGHPVYLDRDSAVPLIGLYELAPGAVRGKDGLIAYYGIALDFDDVPFDAVAETAEILEELGVSYLWHTTWSHLLPGKGERRRLLIPLAEPLHPDSYRSAMALIKAGLAPSLDVRALQCGQAFFAPATTQDRLHEAELFWKPGGGLRLSDLRAPALEIVSPPVHTPPAAPPPPVAVIDREVWDRVATRIQKRTDPRQIDLGRRLSKVVEGLRFAQVGERDSTLWRLCCEIVRIFPDVSADSVVELFRMSLHRMEQDDGEDALTEDDLREKLERAREGHLSQTAARWHPERHEAIRQCFGGSRSTPYTPEEIQEICTSLGVTEVELSRLWIMQAEKVYYLVGPEGKLVSCQREALDNMLRVVLAPAPIDLHKVEPTGRRQITRAEALESYSTPLERVEYSLTIDSPRIDLRERVLTIPACPTRRLDPCFDPEIDRWFRLLAGPLYDKFIQWCSHVPDLRRPLAALVLTGPKSTGKGLLAAGISRIWSTTGSTDVTRAMGSFNDSILACPYCTADEGAIPRDSQGRERTEDLRQFIQETSRAINRKNRDLISLEGATRLQISANNADILALGASLSANDVDAIAARFFHVEASDAAREYLEELGGWEATAPWVAGDGLARHVLWLHRYLAAPWEGRFGVDLQQSLVDKMLVRSGVRSQLCELFLRAIKDPSPLDTGATVRDGTLRVTLDWVLQAWAVFLRQSAKQPTTSNVIKALDGLTSRIDVDGEGWFAVSSEKLVAWGEESGTGSGMKIQEWLERHAAV